MHYPQLSLLAAALSAAVSPVLSLDLPFLPGFDQPTVALRPLEQNANTTELFPMPLCGEFNLFEASIDDMQAGMENGTLTSVQLVTCYMERVFQTQQYIK